MIGRHPIRSAVLVLVLVVVGSAAVVAFQGELEIAPQGRHATSWSPPCYRRPPRPDRQLLHRCARLRGWVLHVTTQRDRYSRDEVHALVAVDFGAVITKMFDPAPAEKPRVGHRIDVVGPLVRSRSGLREVQVFSVR